MRNFDFCDTTKVSKIRLFDIFCKKVYFEGLPGICTVLNNAQASVGILIIPHLIQIIISKRVTRKIKFGYFT